MGKQKIMFLDGYNVIHRSPRFRIQLDRSLLAARESLLQFCSEWMSRRHDVSMFYVVFDGRSDVQGSSAPSAPGIRAVYTSSGETADDRILRLLEQHSRTADCTVVSDDNYVSGSSPAFHAQTLSVQEFCAILEPHQKTNGKRNKAPEGKEPLSPAIEQAITDRLRKEWGLD